MSQETMPSIKLESKSILALKWLIDLLNRLEITYQIAGGLAAKVYGSDRTLVDIDVDLPNDAITKILPDLKDYLVYGPNRYQDSVWDIFLATIDYHGQMIDFTGADDPLMFDQQKQTWIKCEINLSKAITCEIEGIELVVIAKDELIHYKSSLRREVDLLDLEAIQKNREVL